jgi:hypothetical protein
MSASPPATRPPRPGWPVRVGLALLRSLEVTALVLALLLTPLWCSVPTDVERLARERPTTTATIERRRAAARAHDEAFALDWRWRDLDQIAVVLRRAVMMAEDFYFTSHHGVDWGQTLGAIVDNLGSGGQSMGGSTITPAAGQEPLPVTGANAAPQGRRDAHRRTARAGAQQAPHHRAVPEHHRARRRHLRRRGRGAALVRCAGVGAQPRPRRCAWRSCCRRRYATARPRCRRRSPRTPAGCCTACARAASSARPSCTTGLLDLGPP